MPPASKLCVSCKRGEQVGAGQAVHALRLHDALGGLLEQHRRHPAPHREGVDLVLAHVLHEGREHRVRLGLGERQEVHDDLGVRHRVAGLRRLVVVALDLARPHELRIGQALELRFLAHRDHVVDGRARQVVAVAVVLHLLDDRRVRGLGAAAAHRNGVGDVDPRLLRQQTEYRGGGRRRLGVGTDDEWPLQALAVLLHVVLRITDLALVPLRRLVDRGAVDLAARDREAHGVARLDRAGRHRRDVRESRRRARLVRAVGHVVEARDEERPVADHGEVVLAGRDEPVAGVVRVEMRVDEVEHELPPGDTAVGVDVLDRPGDTVDPALEDARRDRIVDVGHGRDVDLLRRHADLGRLGLGVGGAAGGRHQRHPDREHGQGDQRAEPRVGYECFRKVPPR